MSMTTLGAGPTTGGVPPFDPASLPGFLWDSGENPAIGSAIPGGIALDFGTVSGPEIWLVSRGHTVAPISFTGVGGWAGFEPAIYGASLGASTVSEIYWTDVGPRLVKSGTFWTRVTGSPLRLSTTTAAGTTTLEHEINGVTYAGIAIAPPTTAGGTVGQRADGSLALAGQVYRALIYSANLSAPDRATLLAYLRTRYSCQAYTRQVLCAGDSLTAGYNSTSNLILSGWTDGDYTFSYPYYSGQSHTDWKILNHGVTSITLSDMTTNDVTGIDPYYDATFTKNTCVLWAGTNDVVGGASLATVQSLTTAYVSARKSAGFSVALVKMMDRSEFDAAKRVIKDGYNTWATTTNTGADGVVELPVQLAGASPWVTYPTYWDADDTHLSRLGYQTIAAAIGPVVALL